MKAPYLFIISHIALIYSPVIISVHYLKLMYILFICLANLLLYICTLFILKTFISYILIYFLDFSNYQCKNYAHLGIKWNMVNLFYLQNIYLCNEMKCQLFLKPYFYINNICKICTALVYTSTKFVFNIHILPFCIMFHCSYSFSYVCVHCTVSIL